MVTALACGFAIALLSVARTTHHPSNTTVDTYATDQTVTLKGMITDEPDRRPLHTKYTIQVSELTTQSGALVSPVDGRVLVSDYANWPFYTVGDTVRVRGTLEKPTKIESFYYDRYLSRFNVYSVIYRSSIEKIHTNTPLSPFMKGKRFLYDTKQRFEFQINRLFPEPHASFMAGLLTGSRKGIPSHVLTNFTETGLTHIIAISGYNITIIITLISGSLFWLPLRWRFVPSIIAIVLFTVFVGASAAVVRAAIMGILGLCALQAHRIQSVRLGILWTAFFMLLWNPKYLWYDAGFQLSFLSVFGLVELSPWMEKWFQKIPKNYGMREALHMTVAAQIATAPLIIFLFGRISLVSPLANILVAPFIPLAMLFGFVATMMSFVWFQFGQCFAYLAWLCLEWIVIVAELLARLPFATINFQ